MQIRDLHTDIMHINLQSMAALSQWDKESRFCPLCCHAQREWPRWNHPSPSLSERQHVPLVLIFILPIPQSSEYQFMLNTPSQFMQIRACSFVQLGWIACTCANYASKCGCLRAFNYSKCYLLCVGWGGKETFHFFFWQQQSFVLSHNPLGDFFKYVCTKLIFSVQQLHDKWPKNLFMKWQFLSSVIMRDIMKYLNMMHMILTQPL